MTYVRSSPLPAPDAPLWDHGDRWDAFINSIMHRSLPDSLSTPCEDCGERLIVCACCRKEPLA